jgi:hypothetical protein
LIPRSGERRRPPRLAIALAVTALASYGAIVALVPFDLPPPPPRSAAGDYSFPSAKDCLDALRSEGRR